MELCLLLAPIIGAIIGGTVVVVLVEVGKRYLKIEEGELQEDLKSLVDKHLDDLVGAFGRQIPMSSLFLTGPMANKMKTQAREEILKMTPSLKEKLIDRVKGKITKNKYFLKMVVLGAGIGFVLGLVQALVLFLAG